MVNRGKVGGGAVIRGDACEGMPDSSFLGKQFFYVLHILHDIVGLEDAGYDYNAVRSGVNDPLDVFAFDAADAEDGKRDVFAHPADVVEADGDVIRLGWSGKQGAEPDVIGAFRGRADGLIPAVGRFTDEAAGRDAVSGRSHGEIVLSKVERLGADGGGDEGMIVDDERNPGRFAEGVETARQRFDLARDEDAAELERRMDGLPCRRVGTVTGERRLRVRCGEERWLDLAASDLSTAFKETLADG